MGRIWSWDDYDVLRSKYPIEGIAVADRFPGSSADTIRTRALMIGANAAIDFTAEEKEIAKRFGSTLGTALIFLMPERTPVEVEKLLQCVG